MHAAVVTRFGDPGVFELTELPDPLPGPGQVAIDVSHAAVGLIDVYIRPGLYEGRQGPPPPPYAPTPVVGGGGGAFGGRARGGAASVLRGGGGLRPGRRRGRGGARQPGGHRGR